MSLLQFKHSYVQGELNVGSGSLCPVAMPNCLGSKGSVWNRV